MSPDYNTAADAVKAAEGNPTNMRRKMQRAVPLAGRSNGAMGSHRNNPCACGSGKKFKRCCQPGLRP